LLLLLEERLPDLLLPDLLLPLALARPLEERLWALALPPLLAAWARVILPDDDEDLEEEEELRDAIALLLWTGCWTAACHCCGHLVNLGRWAARPVGTQSGFA